MTRQPARLYALVAAGLLLLQGAATLLFRLFPPLDRAFPQLLAVTQMVPVHSVLHIATGLLGLAALRWGGARGAFWFALGFGLFYTGLALFGFITMQPTLLEMKSFDHPVHLFIGLVGLITAGLDYRFKLKEKAST